jgi:hypothetical protein
MISRLRQFCGLAFLVVSQYVTGGTTAHAYCETGCSQTIYHNNYDICMEWVAESCMQSCYNECNKYCGEQWTGDYYATCKWTVAGWQGNGQCQCAG